MKGIESYDSEVFLCEASTSSSRKNSIHIDKYNENYSTMNRESNLQLSPNPKDYESSTNERQGEEFQIIKSHGFHLVLSYGLWEQYLWRAWWRF